MTAKKPVVSPLAQIKELENDPKLIKLCAEHLPSNYDFEIAKTVWRIRKTPNCHTVALQMPEGITSLVLQLQHCSRDPRITLFNSLQVYFYSPQKSPQFYRN